LKNLFVLVALVLLYGCSSSGTIGRPSSYYDEQNHMSNADLPSFSDDAGKLDEAEIQKILSYKLTFPTKGRVAILDLTESKFWNTYSTDFLLLNQEILENFIGKLRESNRIYDASFLPGLLIPKHKTLIDLRLAAIRYQADFLLTYSINCQRFEQFRFLSNNDYKAYCNIEAVAIDTRTGIVPFAAVSTNEFTALKNEKDINFDETKRKAEMKAKSIGLAEIADKLKKFIEQLPKQ
jgi:hypothetical protein